MQSTKSKGEEEETHLPFFIDQEIGPLEEKRQGVPLFWKLCIVVATISMLTIWFTKPDDYAREQKKSLALAKAANRKNNQTVASNLQK